MRIWSRFIFQFALGLSVLGTLTAFMPTAAAQTPTAPTPTVLSVNPTGAVRGAQQVLVKFSHEMVPMGDPKLAAPMEISCKATGETKTGNYPGSGRWVDSKTWSYDFNKPLPAGVRCQLTLKKDTTLAGAKVSSEGIYEFSTGGPTIVRFAPDYGEIEPGQYFLFEFDSPMDPASIEQLVYFESSKSVASQIKARTIAGVERERVLRAVLQQDWQFAKYRELVQDGKPIKNEAPFDRLVVLTAASKFAESSAIGIVWPKGVLSKNKVPTNDVFKQQFKVMEEFSARFTCERSSPERPCNPILDMGLNFTSSVKIGALKGAQLVGPKRQVWKPIELSADPKALLKLDESAGINSLTFKAPFPAEGDFKLILPKAVQDEMGRNLVNQAKFPLAVKTDEYLPLVKFAAPFGILELNAEPILPVSVRNVEKPLTAATLGYPAKTINLNAKNTPREIIEYYRIIQEKDNGYAQAGDRKSRGASAFADPKAAKSFQVPRPGSDRDFEVIGIPLKEPGLHIVEVQSPRLGTALLDGGTMFVTSAALVTNLSVHFKRGRDSSLVWVTTLDKAQVVSGADVSIVDGSGEPVVSGKTDQQGIFRTKAELPCKWDDAKGTYGERCELFVFAKSGNDFSFVSSEWSQGIESYRFNLASEYLRAPWGPFSAHAVLDRAVIQAGEQLNFKIFLRDRTESGFRLIPERRMPKRITITHNATGKVYELPFKVDLNTGAGSATFAVPKTAGFGYYEIKLSQKPLRQARAGNIEAGDSDGGDNEYEYDAASVGNFVVEEYRLPLMESTVKVQGEYLIQPAAAKVDLSASFLSGGPARELPIKVRAAIVRDSFRPDFPGADEYTFFSSPFRIGSLNPNEEKKADQDLNFVFNQSLKLDANGGTSLNIASLPAVTQVRSLNVEMEYRDPNGEVKTGRGQVRLLPSDLIVGLKSETWLAKAGKATVGGVVVRPNGQKVAGAKYAVEAFRSEYTSHRKRIVGGFYSYDSSQKTVSMGVICQGTTDAKGEFVCEATKLLPGSATLQARVLDSKGRPSLASVGVSVYEDSEMAWWAPTDSDRVDLMPEKPSYQPGETAKFVLRSPFPESKVLVTVEREGVVESFVRDLKRENPVFELPVKGQFAPNVYVAAVAIRGRVGQPKPTAILDLARPSVKMGASKILVGWKAHELKVTVKPEKDRYQTRQKVKAKVKIVRADGQPFSGGELTVAVVDESLSLLRKNWSVDLLAAMMGERPWSVVTSTSQVQVIGKRHYGSKARPPGGGGGGEGMESRELFEPVLKWIPNLKVSNLGEADIEFDLNDSITRFKIHAVAASEANYFGSGAATVVASKDLVLYSGFAPVVRDGDQIQNQLTVRNTTSKKMKVDLEIKSPEVAKIGKPQAFELDANQSKTLFVPVTVPIGIKALSFEIAAKDLSGSAKDTVKVKTRVDESLPASVQQATLLQLQPRASLSVQQPKEAVPNRGGVAIDAKSSLVASLLGVRSYMEEYPYNCYEQLTSKAIATESKPELQKVLRDMPSYMDGSGLIKYFPVSICGSAQLTRYILTAVKLSGESIAPETLNRVLAGLEAWLNGLTCGSWWDQYTSQNYRDEGKILVIDALSRWGRFKPEYLKPLMLQPNTWSTQAVVALASLARRQSNFPNRDAVLKESETIVRARLNYQGTGLSLQKPQNWESRWILFSSDDYEAQMVFDMILEAVAAGEKSWIDEAPRMARGIQARQKRGIWDSTMANAIGTLNLRRFSSIFEKETVTGNTSIQAPGSTAAVDWGKDPRGTSFLMKWPEGSQSKPIEMKMEHKGSGRPWVLAQMKSAIPLKGPRDLGYLVSRNVAKVTDSGQLQTTGIKWKNGDVAEVTLRITAKYDHPWVVVRDPVPAGATLMGGSLDGSSQILAATSYTKPKSGEVGSWPTEYEERSFSHFTTYAGYLMKGVYETKYRVRLNSSGRFKLPHTRVEAMYTPENFGEAPIADWLVE